MNHQIEFFLNIIFLVLGSSGLIVSGFMWLRERNRFIKLYFISLLSWTLNEIALLTFFYFNEVIDTQNRLLNAVVNDLSFITIGLFVFFITLLFFGYLQKTPSKSTKLLLHFTLFYQFPPIFVISYLTGFDETLLFPIEISRAILLYFFLYRIAFLVKKESKLIKTQEVKRALTYLFYLMIVFYPFMIVESSTFFERIYPFEISIISLFYCIVNISWVYLLSKYVEMPVLVTENDMQSLDVIAEKFGLTPRETEVTTLLVEGLSYKEVAEKLFISHETVKSHVSNIYKKTGVNNKTELAVLIKSF